MYCWTTGRKPEATFLPDMVRQTWLVKDSLRPHISIPECMEVVHIILIDLNIYMARSTLISCQRYGFPKGEFKGFPRRSNFLNEIIESQYFYVRI